MSAEMKSRRWRRVLVAVVAVVIALPMVAWAVLYGDSVWQRRKAERLFKEFQRLSVGASTAADVRALLSEYSAPDPVEVLWYPNQKCNPTDCVYIVSAANYRMLSHSQLRWTLSKPAGLLDVIGIRPWGVVAEFRVRGALLQRSRFVVDFSSGADTDASCYNASIAVLRVPDNRFYDYFDSAMIPFRNPRATAYSVGKPNVNSSCTGDVLKIRLDERATKAETAKAFDLRLQRLTDFSRGLRPAQIAPSAWRDWIETQRSLSN